MEQKLIASAIKSREAFDDILVHNIDTNLSDKAKIVWNTIKDYYGNDPEAICVDADLIKTKLARAHPKHAELFNIFFDNLEEVSAINVVKEIVHVKLDSVRQKLASEFVAGNDNKIKTILPEYEQLLEGVLDAEIKEQEILAGEPVENIIKQTSGDNRIAVLPSALNAQLKGGVLRQHHIIIFAPTEMGKSLFALNMAYGFLKQGLKVLYVGNEDPALDMVYRLMWRITGMTDDEIRKDPAKADKLLAERNYNNFVFVETDAGTPHQIEELVKEYTPDILIVDQIRNLDMGESNKVIAFEKAAMMMRRLGKKYNLVPVSLTQAADSATGKVILHRGDIDFSNVGIPGTADLLIGIGANEDMEHRGERMLSLVKNKVGQTKEPVKVWFDPAHTKVT